MTATTPTTPTTPTPTTTPTTQPESRLRIANIGSGTMGHATALNFAMAGYPVTLYDQTDALLQHGMDLIAKDATELQDNNALLNGDTAATVISRIHITTDLAQAVSDADFIIESIIENLEIKRKVWQEIERSAPVTSIFATNSSGLSPTQIQLALEHPERFVVAHFWNPAHLMPLVEVVPGEQTETRTVEQTYELMQTIGKKPAKLTRECPGFVGNRIQLAVIREALNIVEQGIADPETVDTVVKYSLGRRWDILGPVASADLGGLDVFYAISKYLLADLRNSTEPNPSLAEHVERHELGAKSGQGYYSWRGTQGERTIQDRDAQLIEDLKRDRCEES